MLAESFGSTAARPDTARWLLGRRSALQFATIFVLALAGAGLSVLVAERNSNAQFRVRHTRDVQLAIDRVVWDLLSLQQAMQAQRISSDLDQAVRFGQLRNDIQDDVKHLTEATADDPAQQVLLVEFGGVFAHYLANLDRAAASEWGNGTAREPAGTMMADTASMSGLIAAMRGREDALLGQRSARAGSLFSILLLTLCLSGAVIAIMVTVAAISINRVIRQRDADLTEKQNRLTRQQMLMREVDHRVRNSLGLIYNLMTFQQQRPDNSEADREFFAEVSNQVLVVARMHERLYKADNSDRLYIDEYLRELCGDVAAYSLPQQSRSAISVHGASTAIPGEQAVWLGLVVVELVTNALKYARPSVQAPILIDVAVLDDQLQVSVSDHGSGLPPSFDPQASSGLGMQVARLLVRQLRGTLGVDRSWTGGRFIVTMPLGAAAA